MLCELTMEASENLLSAVLTYVSLFQKTGFTGHCEESLNALRAHKKTSEDFCVAIMNELNALRVCRRDLRGFLVTMMNELNALRVCHRDLRGFLGHYDE